MGKVQAATTTIYIKWTLGLRKIKDVCNKIDLIKLLNDAITK